MLQGPWPSPAACRPPRPPMGHLGRRRASVQWLAGPPCACVEGLWGVLSTTRAAPPRSKNAP
eukprot:13245908-Alexandrium_andersonii.AAC.1